VLEQFIRGGGRDVRENPVNYRGNSLIPMWGKICSGILSSRLKKTVYCITNIDFVSGRVCYKKTSHG
jgi:hypothetical protein